MMANHIFCYFILLFVVLVVQADDASIEQQQLKHIEQSSPFELFQNFRKPKKIAFSALMGGSSHSHWVISILDELHSRGHETTFITKSDQLKFVKNYPHIKGISIGDNLVDSMDELMRELRSMSRLNATICFIQTLGPEFPNEFIKITNLLESEKYDLIICDSFNNACVEAAFNKNVPFIVTSSLPQGDDTSAPYINNDMLSLDIPTTQYLSLWARIDNMFIKPVKLYWELWPLLKKKSHEYKSLGIKDTSATLNKWKDSVKMYNTAFGLQQGRPLGPLVEFVGPIVKHHVPKMSSDLQGYFSNHKSVAYIAFGQHAIMENRDVELIITGLLEAYENEEIDGIIWATRGLENTFPYVIVTQSNTTYYVKEFFDYNNQSDIMFVDWAPQMAVLSHPSTSLFISHGGSASIYESLYSGVRMVIFPFFADQPQASITAEKNGYGLRLDYRATQDEATRIIRTVAKDKDGTFQKNADRFKALVQIRSKHGVIKGADLVEEVVFLNQDGKVTHRRDVKNDISFIKANNIDLYAFAASITLGGFYVVVRLFIYATKTILTRFSDDKIKQKTL